MRDLPRAGDALTLFTWNLGYAGLGAGSDFVADGGRHVRPPSRAAALANADAIAAALRAEPADIVLLQELAGAGAVNRRVDLKARVDAALGARDQSFAVDFETPWPLAMRHGLAVYANVAIDEAETSALPRGPGPLAMTKRYKLLAARLGDWTVCTLHLAAFDREAALRRAQLAAALDWARSEHQRGQRVVIGGDFNLQLAPTRFAHDTAQKYLFWLHPFPQGALPQGWRIAADAATPSARSNERPYRAGANFTTVIDGFIVSPNVGVDSVAGVDLGFAHSDHNPVRLRVYAQ